MTAEHDAYDGDYSDNSDYSDIGDSGDNGMDALLLALLDEPLPDQARTDAAFLAEHRSAVADVALLREQLGIIGRALAMSPEAEAEADAKAGAAEVCARPERAEAEAAVGEVADEPVGRPARAGKYVPERPYRPRRRPLAVAFGVLAVACAGVVVSGLGWLLVRSGADSADSGGRATSAQADSKEAAAHAFGSPRYLACARIVAEGTVTAVDPVPGAGQDRITLDVTRSYQPETGEDQITFMREDGVHPRLRAGDEALVGLPRDGVHPDAVFVGEKKIAPERALITASLPESRTLTCE